MCKSGIAEQDFSTWGPVGQIQLHRQSIDDYNIRRQTIIVNNKALAVDSVVLDKQLKLEIQEFDFS